MTGTPPVLVVAPLPEELAALRSRIANRRTARLGGRTVVTGTLSGEPVVAAVLGDGARRAKQALGALLGATSPRLLLGIGVAGGLDPARRWGEVLAARDVRGDGVTWSPPHPEWQARAEALGLPVVPFAVAPRIVPTPDAKQALRTTLGGEPACVDLESGVIAEAAGEAGVPYLVLRAVVDEAGETVARSILAAEDQEGHVAKAWVVAAALLRPREIGHLKRIAKRVETCAARLADAVEALLGEAAQEA